MSCDGDNCTDGQTCEGSKSNNNLHCQTTYCPVPDVIPYGRSLGNMNHLGAKRLYICNGAAVNGSVVPTVSECLKNGSWSDVKCLPFLSPREDKYMHTSMSRNYPDVSKDECARTCFDSGLECTIFNYHALTRNCTHVYANKRKDQCSDSGWVVVKKIFPVLFSANYTDVGTLTLEEARERCIERKSEIATRSDLHMAYQMGYSTCRCGFIDTGLTFVVINFYTHRSDCGMRVGIHECDLSTKTDVFCKNPKFVDNGILNATIFGGSG